MDGFDFSLSSEDRQLRNLEAATGLFGILIDPVPVVGSGRRGSSTRTAPGSDLSMAVVLANLHGDGDSLLCQSAMLRSKLREGGFMGVPHGKAIFLPTGRLRRNLDEQLPDIDDAARLAFKYEIEIASCAG